MERDGRNYEFNWRLQNCYALVAFNYMFLVPWNWYVVERKKEETKKKRRKEIEYVDETRKGGGKEIKKEIISRNGIMA